MPNLLPECLLEKVKSFSRFNSRSFNKSFDAISKSALNFFKLSLTTSFESKETVKAVLLFGSADIFQNSMFNRSAFSFNQFNDSMPFFSVEFNLYNV